MRRKILPVFGTDGKALIQVLGLAAVGSRVYDPRGPPVHRLPEVEERGEDRAVSDGAGHSTILFCGSIGRPIPTENARCLTARYSQTTLCNHRGERSGVLLIKEGNQTRLQGSADR